METPATIQELYTCIQNNYQLLNKLGIKLTKTQKKMYFRLESEHTTRRQLFNCLDMLLKTISKHDTGWNSITTPDCVVEGVYILSFRR